MTDESPTNGSSPYQAMLSHRRYNSAMGKHPLNEQESGNQTQEEIQNKTRKLGQAAANARSVASLKGRASNAAVRGSGGNAAAGANAADKSSLFADIVSLRESNTSSRQLAVATNQPKPAIATGSPTQYKLPQSQSMTTTPYKLPSNTSHFSSVKRCLTA